MEQKLSEADTLNIIITTIILLFFGCLVVYFIFQYQRKRFRHKQEMLELKEAFNNNLLQSKIEIQEQTLGHIARELHDNISPLISIIQINLGTPKLKNNPDIKSEVLELKSNASQLMTELKSLSVTLNTDHVMHRGFADALWLELDRLERTRQFKTIRTITGEKFRLRPEHEIILFRMCQELLNNIIKHAKAKTITVQLNYTVGKYHICIIDDGIGLNWEEAEKNAAEKNSTGLMNVRSRAKLINANLRISSAPSQGTRTEITVADN